MRKRLRKFAVIVSLMLCVAVLGLWIRSQSVADKFAIYRYLPIGTDVKHDAYSALTTSSGIYFRYYFYTTPPWGTTHALGTFMYHQRLRPREGSGNAPAWLVFGLGWSSTTYEGDDYGSIDAAMPYWFLVFITAILPLAWAKRAWWTRRRFAPGHCQTCGYDLRATPDRCPECGTAPKAPKFAASETSPPAGG